MKKYLFFDIECANCYNNCAKLFSLGYVVTDENFNIIREKEDVLINPRDRFDWYVAKKMMAYPREIFADKPAFPEFYDFFREMFEDPDTVVIGYAVTNDVHFLQDDCKRYDLMPYTYRFYDVQQIYARQPENNTARNLEDSLLAWCGIEAENMHRSDEDAYNTMLILKAICAYHGKNITELLEAYPDCGGYTEGFTMEYAWKKPEGESKKKRHRGGKKKKKEAEGEADTVQGPDVANMMEAGSENAKLFLKYLASIQPKKTRKPPLLSGHTVTVSLGYQRYHFNEMLYLAQMIVNEGGRYTLATREADILFTYDCGEEGDQRLAAAEAMQAAGNEIEIHPIKVLFDTLETSEVKLSRKPKMDLSYLMDPAPVSADAMPAEAEDTPETEAFVDKSEESVPV